jgi:uncharacterized protein YbjQ (UPF0145 family)
MSTPIWISRVVTRNIVGDTVAWVQNVFGARLKGYEKMAQNGFDQIQEELKEKHPNGKMLWYRYEITQLTDGALFIVMYGELE